MTSPITPTIGLAVPLLLIGAMLGFVAGFMLAQFLYRKLLAGYAEICTDYRDMLEAELVKRPALVRQEK